MRISNFSSMCHFFLISRGRARQLHLKVSVKGSSLHMVHKKHYTCTLSCNYFSVVVFYCYYLQYET